MSKNSKKCIYVFGSNRKFLGLKKYFDEKDYTLIFISGELEGEQNTTKKSDQMFSEFNSYYEQSQFIEAFISFGKGSLVGNIEEIAKTFKIIKNNHPECINVQLIGPSEEAAEIFCNKYLTYKALKDLDIPVPLTIEVFGNSLEEILTSIPKNINFPIVLKAEDLSGGRGMKYTSNVKNLKENISHFYEMGIKKFIFSEYVSGVEATFTVFRLGNTFMRLPASYKQETTPDLKHPDSKVKISGMLTEFDQYFEYVEKIMRKYSIFGFFSLQGVLLKNYDKYSAVFIEAAPRMTGSTPIMEASLVGFNIFETISLWIRERKIEFSYTKRLSIQYSSYIHEGKETTKKLKENSWIVESKYEDLSQMLYSEDSKNRIRISFFINDKNELQEKLNIISLACRNNNFTKDVNDVFEWFSKNHKNLVDMVDKKVLEGSWSEDSKWEFYLSSTLPSIDLCSAVFGIPKIKDGFLLTKTVRGWEFPGGHIEKNETIVETLKREILEEVGYTMQRAIFYGYRKIITSKILYNKNQEPYPYPISYIPHFIVDSDLEITKPTGEEVLESGLFKINSPEIENSHVKNIIKIGVGEIDRV